MKFNPPRFLKIATDEELNALRRALQMQFDMEDDIVLEETVTSVDEVRALAMMSDDDIRSNLIARRKATDASIDNLLATVELQNSLQKVIDNLPD